MADKKDGGSAFPSIGVIDLGRRVIEETGNHGMSLRDYFAGQALPAVIAKIPLLKDDDPDGVVPSVPLVMGQIGDEIRSAAADLAYRYADAMLKAREASHA